MKKIGDKNPKIELTHDLLFCSKHLEPFQRNWPKNFILAMLGMFNAALLDERIANMSNRESKKINFTLSLVKPVCCFLRKEITDEVIKLALEGKVFGDKKAERSGDVK